MNDPKKTGVDGTKVEMTAPRPKGMSIMPPGTRSMLRLICSCNHASRLYSEYLSLYGRWGREAATSVPPGGASFRYLGDALPGETNAKCARITGLNASANRFSKQKFQKHYLSAPGARHPRAVGHYYFKASFVQTVVVLSSVILALTCASNVPPFVGTTRTSYSPGFKRSP